MQTEAGDSQASGGMRLQRALVLELLDGNVEADHSLPALAEALGAGRDEIGVAVEALRAAGVVCVEGDLSWASPAARRLDELELIAI
jgi:hypothetical protein